MSSNVASGPKGRQICFYGRVRRACDACRARKVRCEGRQPCSSCERMGIECAFRHKQGKGGRKPRVATPAPSDGIDESIVPVPEVPSEVPAADYPPWVPEPDKEYALGPACSLAPSLPSQALLPLVELFFERLYPIMPVVDRGVLDLLRDNAPLTSHDYCMLTAAAALTAVQLSLQPDIVQQGFPSLTAEVLVRECLAERSRSDYIEHATVSTVATSFFLFGYYGNLERHNKARHYLREAIAFAEAIGLDDDSHDCERRRIVYWLLFVTDRAYALQRCSAVKMRAAEVPMPSVFRSDDPQLLFGFVSLVDVFRTIDTTFLSLWAGSSSLSKEWLVAALRRLEPASDAVLAEALEKHRLDICVSQQWLRLLLWKLCTRQGLLTLGSANGPFSLQFPIRLAADMVKTMAKVSQTSLDAHGIGMVSENATVSGTGANESRSRKSQTLPGASPTCSSARRATCRSRFAAAATISWRWSCSFPTAGARSRITSSRCWPRSTPRRVKC